MYTLININYIVTYPCSVSERDLNCFIKFGNIFYLLSFFEIIQSSSFLYGQIHENHVVIAKNGSKCQSQCPLFGVLRLWRMLVTILAVDYVGILAT